MSVSSESASSQHFYEVSDGEGAVASSSVSEVQEKRKRNPQILGKAWVLRGEITVNMLNNDSDQADMHGDVENDAKVQTTKSQIQAALGAKFESLFVKMVNNGEGAAGLRRGCGPCGGGAAEVRRGCGEGAAGLRRGCGGSASSVRRGDAATPRWWRGRSGAAAGRGGGGGRPGGGAGCGATGRVGGGAGCCGRTDARMIRGPLCSSDWKIEMPKRTLSFLWNWRSTWTRQEGLYSGIVSYFIVKPKTAKIPSW
jgi:hypothetical protein